MSPTLPKRLGAAAVLVALVGGGWALTHDTHVVNGTPATDVITAPGGAMRVRAAGGPDTVTGGLRGDDINGNGGPDHLDGGDGADTVHGGAGPDVVSGGRGDDRLAGDRGDDTLTGGPGADEFVIRPAGGHDVVTDFNAAEGDRILLQDPGPAFVEAVAGGAGVRLQDRSELTLTRAKPEDVQRAIERPLGAFRSQFAMAAAVMAALLGLSAVLALVLRQFGRGRAASAPADGLAPLSPDAPTPAAPASHWLDPHDRNLGLDLMRAAAVLLVMGSHWASAILGWYGIGFDPQWLFSGQLGVQLFFALSGFLIGSILIGQGAADPSVRNYGVFMVRRWMRTLPLYWVVLAVIVAVSAPLGGAPAQGLRFATMTQNLFSDMPPATSFGVAWSLPIEEWFYLLFGASAFLAFRIVRHARAVWAPVVAFLALPLLLRLHVGEGHVALALLDQIAFGVVMAQLYRAGAWPFRQPLACAAAGLALIAMAWRIDDPFFADMTVLGCALLIPVALRLRRAPKMLEAAIRGVSAQSYALYLIHTFVLIELAQKLMQAGTAPRWACAVLAIVGPFAISYLSFRFFEAPILRLRPRHASAVSAQAPRPPEQPPRQTGPQGAAPTHPAAG